MESHQTYLAPYLVVKDLFQGAQQPVQHYDFLCPLTLKLDTLPE